MREHCPGCCGNIEKDRFFPNGGMSMRSPCPGAPLPPAVQAVLQSAQIMRSILLPIFDYVPLTDKMRGEVWSAMKGYDDALAALAKVT